MDCLLFLITFRYSPGTILLVNRLIEVKYFAPNGYILNSGSFANMNRNKKYMHGKNIVFLYEKENNS